MAYFVGGTLDGRFRYIQNGITIYRVPAYQDGDPEGYPSGFSVYERKDYSHAGKFLDAFVTPGVSYEYARRRVVSAYEKMLRCEFV